MNNFFQFSRQDAKTPRLDKEGFLGDFAAWREVKTLKNIPNIHLRITHHASRITVYALSKGETSNVKVYLKGKS
jgi:hypothetical protein